MQILSKTSKVNRNFGWLVWAFLFLGFLGALFVCGVIVWGLGDIGVFCGSGVLLGFFNDFDFIKNWERWETQGSELNQVIVTVAAPIA